MRDRFWEWVLDKLLSALTKSSSVKQRLMAQDIAWSDWDRILEVNVVQLDPNHKHIFVLPDDTSERDLALLAEKLTKFYKEADDFLILTTSIPIDVVRI